jgi:very-short-patch-repair endonuclease
MRLAIKLTISSPPAQESGALPCEGRGGLGRGRVRVRASFGKWFSPRFGFPRQTCVASNGTVPLSSLWKTAKMQRIWKNARALRNTATDAERKLWQHLRTRQFNGVKFRRQYPIAGHIADFASPAVRLVIELDGGQHLEQQQYDSKRAQRMRANGYRVLRFWNDDVLLRMEHVLDEIWRAINATPPQPSPAVAGEGAEGGTKQ